jgi:hypothetical protein
MGAAVRVVGDWMRGRLITNVPGLNPDGSPFERLQQFARMTLKVSKAEADGLVVVKSSLSKKPTKVRRRNNRAHAKGDEEKKQD